MLITQKERILDLFYSVQEAHTLIFIISTKVNRWEVKKDRKLFADNQIFLFKANTYRSIQVFNSIPFFKRLSNSIQGFFFLAHIDQKKDYKKLLDIFNIKSTYMTPVCVIQNNTLFSKNRAVVVNKLPEKKSIACALAISPCYFLIQRVYVFLIITLSRT